jgi:hypothetical protein
MLDHTTATLEATTVEALEDLLKACRAAKETYDIAIRRIERRHDEAAIALRVLEQDHAENVHKVQKMLLSLGGDPVQAGAGRMEKAVEGVASLLGDGPALRPLMEEERRCLAAARRAETALEEGSKELLEIHMIPRLEKHIELLESLSERA